MKEQWNWESLGSKAEVLGTQLAPAEGPHQILEAFNSC